MTVVSSSHDKAIQEDG